MKAGSGEEGVGLFPGKHSEMEVCMQECYWRVLLGPAPVEEGRSRTGQREGLGCGAIPTEVSGAPLKTSRAGMMLQSCPSLVEGDQLLYKILHVSVTDEGFPRKVVA